MLKLTWTLINYFIPLACQLDKIIVENNSFIVRYFLLEKVYQSDLHFITQ